jgi:hypothetical protein
VLNIFLGECANCSLLHGKCVNGFCHCKIGWEGDSCDVQGKCVWITSHTLNIDRNTKHVRIYDICLQ